METFLCASSDSRRLRLCVREELASKSKDLSLLLQADLDPAGTNHFSARLRRGFRLELPLFQSCRADVSTALSTARPPSYACQLRGHADLDSDGLLFVEARLGCSTTSKALRTAFLGGYKSSAGKAAAARARKTTTSSSATLGAEDLKALLSAVRPEGRVEVSRLLLNVNGKQDVKLSAGFNVSTQELYVAAKEDAWAVRVVPATGRWEATFSL